jgi:hypothetical protein
MKVDVWKIPKKTNIEFAQKAPIILKIYDCCRKNRIDKNIFTNKSCRK